MASSAASSRVALNTMRRLARRFPSTTPRSLLPHRQIPRLDRPRPYSVLGQLKSEDRPPYERRDRDSQEVGPEMTEEEMQNLSDADLEQLELEAELAQEALLKAVPPEGSVKEGDRVGVVENPDTGDLEWLAERSETRTAVDASPESSTVPWFVDPAFPDISPSTPPEPPISTSVAPPPPADLPPFLRPLHSYLTTSPFLDPWTFVFINAKQEEQGMGAEAWADWVVVCQLREGRERGLAGAVEGIRNALTSILPGRKIKVEGLDNPTSQWAMLDGGSIAVHVLTADAREAFDIEGVWTGKRRAEVGQGEEGGGAGGRRRLKIF